MVLQTAVQYTDYIRPVCLPINSHDDIGNIGNGYMAGWGMNQFGVLHTEEPRMIQVPVVSDAECLREDGFNQITSNRTFCGGGGLRFNRNGSYGHGPCQGLTATLGFIRILKYFDSGDSGSGLVVRKNNRWILRGLTSASLKHPVTGQCDAHNYAVFTDILKFISWIRSILKIKN